MAETESNTPVPPTPDEPADAKTPDEPAAAKSPEKSAAAKSREKPAAEAAPAAPDAAKTPTESAAKAAPAARKTPAEPAAEAATPAPSGGPKEYIWGVGRRKSSVARVRIRPGSGEYKINKRDVDEYFPLDRHRLDARAPLEAAQAVGKWDVFVNVKGGGITGQAGAVLLGLARALVKASPDVEGALRDGGLLTRDSRMVERKKYGRRGARRSFQFSKR